MTTYYVCPSTGSDANAGTAFGAGSAWKTTQKAADTATAGDLVLLCAEAVENISAAIDFDTQTGGIGNPVRFEGRDGTDGTTVAQYTIRFNGISGDMLKFDTAASKYYLFKNLTVDGQSAASTCLTNTVSNVVLGLQFIDCVFTGATGDGLIFYNSSSQYPWLFMGCSFTNNGGVGCNGNTNAGFGQFFGCLFGDNGSHGLQLADPCFVSACLMYGNTGSGCYVNTNAADGFAVYGSTMYGNGGSGLDVPSASLENWAAIGNSFVSNGAYGFNKTTSPETDGVDYNHYYGNTSGHCNLVSDANINNGTVGTNNQVGDPLFVDAGNEDFRPTTGSPLIRNGLMGQDIGARRGIETLVIAG